MNAIAEVVKGLGNLSLEQRREIYHDLRTTLNISDTAPMLPLPKAELAAWARVTAQLAAVAMANHPSTRGMADVDLIERLLLEYGKPADDAFLDAQLAFAPQLRAAGFSGLYIHAFVNVTMIACARQAARVVLPPASVTVIEEQYPKVMLLRHALMQEGFLGLSAMETAA